MTSLIVSSGVTSSGADVGSGSYVEVLSGGSAVSATISSGGGELVLSGGTASGTDLLSGGTLVVLPGADVVATTSASGGHVISGGATVIVNPMSMTEVLGTATVNVADGATGYVLSGAYAISAVLDIGATLNVLGGGASFGSLLVDGGTEYVSSGALASAGVIENSGTEYILAGGREVGDSVQGGVQFVDGSGSASSGTVEGNSGGIGDDTFGGEGFQLVSAGGSAEAMTLVFGGIQEVAGFASGTVVSSGGEQQVFGGGVASATSVGSDGYLLVAPGGTVDGATIGSGAVGVVYGGAVASGTVLSSGGTLIVLPGAQVSDTLSRGGTVSSATVLTLNFSGGFITPVATPASGGTIAAADLTVVLSGGRLSDVTNLGSAVIDSGGVASGISDVLSNSGDVAIDLVAHGGVASGTQIGSGGWEQVVGSSLSPTVGYDGYLTVSSGGVTSGATVNSGGAEDMLAGATAIGTHVSAGGFFDVNSGSTADRLVVGGGALSFVYFDGVASGTVVSGTLVVMPGASATATTIARGGHVVSTGVVENSDVFEPIFVGAALFGQTVASGSTADVLPGGTIEYDVIKGMGSLIGSAVASGNIVGGSLSIGSGSVARTDLVAGDGIQTIYNGAVASGSLISGAGAEEVVRSGGTSIDAGVFNGGTEFVYSGGVTSGLTLEIGGSLGLDANLLSYSSAASATLSAGDVLSVSNGTQSVSIQLAGDYSGDEFVVGLSGTDNTLVTLEPEVPCYVRGTRILTDRGEVEVEGLKIGDRVVNHQGAARPIVWIGRRGYAGRFIAGNRNVLPVLFRQNAFGDGVPSRDLRVSPLHAMYFDGVLIPAWALINGSSVVQMESVETVEYFHVELASHDVIIAEGAASESFVDDNGRGMFLNAGEYRALYPQGQSSPAEYCAPRVEAGEVVERVWARLAARAAALDMGTVVEAEAPSSAQVMSVLVPAGIAKLRLVSQGRPPVLGVVVDGCRLDMGDTDIARCFGDGVLDLGPSKTDRWCHIEVEPFAAPLTATFG